VCTLWVPRCLTGEHKNRRFVIVFSHIRRFKDEGTEFVEPTVTGDETRVQGSAKKKKKAGMEWKYLTSSTAETFKVCQSAGKVTASVIWDAKRDIHVKFMLRGTTINKSALCMRRSREEILTSVARCDSEQDNATHTEHVGHKQLLHRPPCSPGLNFRLFGPLKQHLGCRRFHNNGKQKRKWLFL
jgi:hypothetical protein